MSRGRLYRRSDGFADGRPVCDADRHRDSDGGTDAHRHPGRGAAADAHAELALVHSEWLDEPHRRNRGRLLRRVQRHESERMPERRDDSELESGVHRHGAGCRLVHLHDRGCWRPIGDAHGRRHDNGRHHQRRAEIYDSTKTFARYAN